MIGGRGGGADGGAVGLEVFVKRVAADTPLNHSGRTVAAAAAAGVSNLRPQC